MKSRFLDKIIRTAASAYELVLSLIYPPRCMGCGELIPMGREHLCPDCRRELEREKDEGCLGCGRPYHACRCRPKYLSDRVLFSALPYKSESSVSRELILLCKRKRNRAVFTELATHMAEVLEKNGIGRDYYLTYSPRAGVNGLRHDQAKELAWELSRITGNPAVTTLRCRNTYKEQKSLKINKRIENAMARYRVPRRYVKRIAGRSFVMIDDVVTSGATADRCAQLLIDNGASDVICFCAARTVDFV